MFVLFLVQFWVSRASHLQEEHVGLGICCWIQWTECVQRTEDYAMTLLSQAVIKLVDKDPCNLVIVNRKKKKKD